MSRWLLALWAGAWFACADGSFSELEQVTEAPEDAEPSPSAWDTRTPPDAGPIDGLLQLTPESIDFGTVEVGCEVRNGTVTVKNLSSVELVLDAIEQRTPPQPAFQSLPVDGLTTVSPNASLTFEVTFRAGSVSAYAGVFEVRYRFGDTVAQQELPVVGRGGFGDRQVDAFQVLPPPKVDILLVIDGTASMADEQETVSSNLQAFLQFVEAQGIDYHIGVVSADGSGVLRRTSSGAHYLTPGGSPHPSMGLSELIRVGISDSEPALSSASARAALSDSLRASVNRDFVRDNSVLSVIFITDGPDGSPGSVLEDLNFFQSIKGPRNSQLLSVSAITAPFPPGRCEGRLGSAESDGRLAELTERTGGIFQSICVVDWSRALESNSRAGPLHSPNRFYLTNQPVVSTIEVYVGQVEIPRQIDNEPANWVYDFASNAITFAPWAMPEPGAQFRVTYFAECL